MNKSDAAVLPAVSDFSSYLREIAKFPMLSLEREQELADNYSRKGCLRSAHALVCSHLRQVAAIARGYNGYGLPQPDLVQEGNIGLMKAVKKFDSSKGVRLNVYAAFWIRSQINEFVIRNWRIVKVATTNAQRKLFFNLRRMTQQIGRKLGHDKVAEIAGELNVAKKDVLEMNRRMNSYDVPFDSFNTDLDKPDTSPSAVLEADEGMHAELAVVESSVVAERRAALRSAVDSLNEREQMIVKARALSESGKDVTLAELAEQFGVSSERIRQIEAKALKKIAASVRELCQA